MAQVYKADDSFDYSIFQGSSCAFGVFDGVHRGHQYLLKCAQKTAAADGGASIALTFDIDPDELFQPDRLKKLVSNERRLSMLADSGVDAVVALPFTKAFAGLSPVEFLEKTFNGHAPAHLHVGLDFRFGARAAGSVADLAEWGAEAGCHIDAHNLRSAEGRPITATRIRSALAKHDLAQAEELLGRRYNLIGKVVRGRGQGADMGFSTANVEMPANRLVLDEGVYSAYALVDGQRYRSAVCIGVSPVFKATSTANCEAHILDFSRDIYGQPIELDFVEYLRPNYKFESVDELIATVMGNIDYVRQNLPL